MTDKIILETPEGRKEVDRVRSPLPCIVCKNELWNVFFEDQRNHPNDACAFTSHGHYGSKAFDAFDGGMLEVNICDECLKTAMDRKQVGYWTGLPKRKMKLWEGE